MIANYAYHCKTVAGSAYDDMQQNTSSEANRLWPTERIFLHVLEHSSCKGMSWLVQAFYTIKTEVVKDDEVNPTPYSTRNIPYFCENTNVRNTVKETPSSSGIVQPLQKSNFRNTENETLCIFKCPRFYKTRMYLAVLSCWQKKALGRDLRYSWTSSALRSRYVAQ